MVGLGSITASAGTLTVKGIASTSTVTLSTSMVGLGSITASAGTLTVKGIASTSTVTLSTSMVGLGSITASAGTLTVSGITATNVITATTMSATTFSNPSDRRLKANVNSLEARAKHIFSLNGVSFNYKRKLIRDETAKTPSLASSADDLSQDAKLPSSSRRLGAVSADGVVDTNSTHFGFIAQEVEGQFPELVGRDSQGFRSVQYGAFVPLIIEGMKEQRSDSSELRSELYSELDGLRSQLREAGVLLSLPSPSATTTTRTVSVKGLSATGAVTAHHDLVHTRRTGVLEATGREALVSKEAGEGAGERRRRSGAQGGEQTEGDDEALRRRVGSMEEELVAAKAETRRVEAEAKAETRRVEAKADRAEAEAREAKAEMEEKLLALLKLVEDLTRKAEGSGGAGGTRGGA
jgi:hypothetical protein